MQFQKLLENFNQKYANVGGKITELTAKKILLTEKFEQIRKTYNEMVVNESMGDSKWTPKELLTGKKEIEKTEREIVDIDSMIETLRDNRNEQLRKFLPKIAEECDAEIREIVQQVNESAEELRKFKAEFLIAVLELNKLYRAAQEKRSRLVNIAHMVGSNEYDRGSISMPLLNMTSTYEPDKALAPLQYEVEKAYKTGVLPSWVEWYRRHGELLSDGDAFRKLDNERRNQ